MVASSYCGMRVPLLSLPRLNVVAIVASVFRQMVVVARGRDIEMFDLTFSNQLGEGTPHDVVDLQNQPKIDIHFIYSLLPRRDTLSVNYNNSGTCLLVGQQGGALHFLDMITRTALWHFSIRASTVKVVFRFEGKAGSGIKWFKSAIVECSLTGS